MTLDANTKQLAVVIPVKDNFQGLQKTLEVLWKETAISEHVEIAVVDAGHVSGNEPLASADKTIGLSTFALRRTMGSMTP